MTTISSERATGRFQSSTVGGREQQVPTFHPSPPSWGTEDWSALLQAADALDPSFTSPQDRYLYDPVAFSHDLFRWGISKDIQHFATYQDEILVELVEYGRVCVRGPHILGKTAVAAHAILWFAITREAAGIDWKIPCTASAWKQLENYLWPEVKKWSRILDWEKLGRAPFREGVELLSTSLKLHYGSAFCTASDIPENIEGAHATHLLYIFDEAKTIPPETFDAAEGALASGNDRTGGAYAIALAISTPGPPVGRFYDICVQKLGTRDWHTKHVTKEEAIAAGRMSLSWAHERALQWGVNSPMYQNRVEGNFFQSRLDGIIPYEHALALTEHTPPKPLLGQELEITLAAVAVDVATTGTDRTYLAPRWLYTYRERTGDYRNPVRTETWHVIGDLIEIEKEDTEDIADEVYDFVLSNGSPSPPFYAVVDVNGVGAGVGAALRRKGIDVEGYNGGVASIWTDSSGELIFANRRAASWWGVRELCDPSSPSSIAAHAVLPNDEDLLADLCIPRYEERRGRIVVEDKKSVRRRLERSPDKGDAVVMVLSDRLIPSEERIVVYDERVEISPF